MRSIPLTQGFVAIVSDSDYALVSSRKWYVMRQGKHKIYAGTKDNSGEKQRDIYLHRFLFGEPKGVLIDHRDGDGLNCVRSNLRKCSSSENGRNRRGAQPNSKSGVRGVHWCKACSKWMAYIRVNGKSKNLGRFDSKEDAAKICASAREKYFGEFAGRH